MGVLAVHQGDHDVATAVLQQSLTQSETCGDHLHAGLALNYLAIGAAERANLDFERVSALFDAARLRFQRVANTYWVAGCVTNLGMVASATGGYQRAITLLEEAFVLHHARGTEWGVATTAVNIGLAQLGLAQVRCGDGQAARHWLREGIVLGRQHSFPAIVAEGMEGLAEASILVQHTEKAARLFGVAEHLRHSIGMALPTRNVLPHDAALTTVRKALGAAVVTRLLAERSAMSLNDDVTERRRR